MPITEKVLRSVCCLSFYSVRDGKVRRSVERIFSIWEERSVYPEEVIAQFKANLNKKEKEREKQKEKEKEKEKVKEKEKEKEATPANGQFVTSEFCQCGGFFLGVFFVFKPNYIFFTNMPGNSYCMTVLRMVDAEMTT